MSEETKLWVGSIAVVLFVAAVFIALWLLSGATWAGPA